MLDYLRDTELYILSFVSKQPNLRNENSDSIRRGWGGAAPAVGAGAARRREEEQAWARCKIVTIGFGSQGARCSLQIRTVCLGIACALQMGGLAAAINAAMEPAAKLQASATAGAEKGASTPQQTVSQGEAARNTGLVIEPAELPGTYPHGPYQINFVARGNYVPVLRWSVVAGALPPGITLDENGALHGEAQRAGEYQFVLTVRDGGKPEQKVQKGYTIKVVEAITMVWKVPPHVNANRIEGSVEVSNTTADDMDFTFDVKAVAEDGRATEIGYQRFPLKKGTIAMAIPFGETLPHGGYVVYVNANGEVAKRNAIYKQRLQTPGLQVLVGP